MCLASCRDLGRDRNLPRRVISFSARQPPGRQVGRQVYNFREHERELSSREKIIRGAGISALLPSARRTMIVGASSARQKLSLCVLSSYRERTRHGRGGRRRVGTGSDLKIDRWHSFQRLEVSELGGKRADTLRAALNWAHLASGIPSLTAKVRDVAVGVARSCPRTVLWIIWLVSIVFNSTFSRKSGRRAL